MPRRPSLLDPTASPLAFWGAELRVRREEAGLSQNQLGERTNYAGSYIGAVERAEEMPRRTFAASMDQTLDAGGALLRGWDGLLKNNVYPAWFDWPPYEASATMLRSFQLAVVHGLLQTEDYASDLLYGDENAVAGRLARQAILTRTDSEPPLLVCVLDENVLHREFGGPAVMRAQLDHLAAIAESERISIHILPSRRHRGVNGSFTLATLEDRSEVAYIDTAARGITTAEPRDLTVLNERFESVRSMAYSADQSLEIITRTARERWS